jgi:hypothetical protein
LNDFLAARECEGTDGFRPLLQKDSCTGIEGRSGGEDIVNEQQVLICHLGILAQRKSIPQVLPALGAIERRLRASVAVAQENIAHRDSRVFREVGGKHSGLIEFTLTQALWMKWDWHKSIKLLA